MPEYEQDIGSETGRQNQKGEGIIKQMSVTQNKYVTTIYDYRVAKYK